MATVSFRLKMILVTFSEPPTYIPVAYAGPACAADRHAITKTRYRTVFSILFIGLLFFTTA
jgi:hypothetical protein